ncbi:MAG: vWA domain-containing protein [Planctomycetaceae bacterium]
MLPFARPLLLVLLALPLWLVVRVWRRREGQVVVPFDHSEVRHSRWLSWPLRVAESLPAATLSAVILLLAGPQQLGQPESRREMTNIEFCVDISGSMTATFGEGTRYDAAMEAINQFVEYREGDAFGLTFFGNSVLHWVPLTQDVSAIRCAPPFMDPQRYIPGFGGTEIGKALLACRNVLKEREQGDRMIVLVSDGWSSDLMGDRSIEIAEELKKDGVIVYAIHIAESEVPGDIVNIAGLTGGDVFEVGDPAALEAVFQRIDEMQQAELEQLAPDTLDDFRPYALAGLAMLAVWVVTLFGLRLTPW